MTLRSSTKEAKTSEPTTTSPVTSKEPSRSLRSDNKKSKSGAKQGEQMRTGDRRGGNEKKSADNFEEEALEVKRVKELSRILQEGASECRFDGDSDRESDEDYVGGSGSDAQESDSEEDVGLDESDDDQVAKTVDMEKRAKGEKGGWLPATKDTEPTRKGSRILVELAVGSRDRWPKVLSVVKLLVGLSEGEGEHP